uniref:Uncharacterized protein n=1 Tax=Ciona savignyi TaxID=51511 RepID=H2ZIQ8_CIOSA
MAPGSIESYEDSAVRQIDPHARGRGCGRREEAKNCEPLPASSKYYKTSASKARILNLVKE